MVDNGSVPKAACSLHFAHSVLRTAAQICLFLLNPITFQTLYLQKSLKPHFAALLFISLVY